MKKLTFIFAIILCLPFVLFGCQKEEQFNQYNLNVTYNEQEQTLLCEQETRYVNKSNACLNEICFYLYANAFGENEKAVPTSYESNAYPNGKSFWGIEFENIRSQGKDLEYEISDNKAILSVKMSKNLYPDECFLVNMKYTVSLVNINHRLGYGEKTVNFGNFFPIACVYNDDGSGFVKNGFSASGDPFFSDVSNFNVTFSCPEKYVVASTGNKTESVSNGQKIAECNAQKVRDFCLVASENFSVIEKNCGETTVKYYFYDDEKSAEHLDVSVKALQIFEKLFGKYPYKQLSVVKNNFCFGGMEYPNLVMISDAVEDGQMIDYVIVHEIAHQWWYGLVGNNEYQEAWLDEGLTEFSTAVFFEKNPEYKIDYKITMQNAADGYKNFVSIYSKINGSVDESMNRNLSQFATEPEYVNCVYTKGMLFFDSLRQTLGDRKFFKCLRDYFKKFEYKNATGEGMIESFSKSAKIKLEPYFLAWIEGKVVIK